MRRRLTVFVAACTSAVLVAFLVPLALLLRQLAEDRAMREATVSAQTIAATLASSQPANYEQTAESIAGPAFTAGMTVRVPEPNGIKYIGPAVPDTAPGMAEALKNTAASSGSLPGGGAYVAVPSVSAGKEPIVVRIALTPAQLHAGVAYATTVIVGLGLLLTVASIFAADRLARRVVAPIHQVVLAADAMREGRLDVQVPETGPEEVVALGSALNRLARRVNQLLAAERDAVADLSHRLRTPVTALRLDVETITDPELATRLRGHLGQLERTVDAIVHGARRPGRSPAGSPSCDVGKVVGERVQFWSALADDQGRSLQIGLPQQRLMARLDASELADVVDVLIDNVFAHTDDGVPIEVWVAPRADGLIAVTVEDGGPGLPSVDVVVRGASSRGSSGLGLDIARRASLASGGSMELGRSGLGGALVRVLLGPADE